MHLKQFIVFFSIAAYRKGEIPRYLREIKEKSEEMRRLEADIDVNCPPGHVGLSDSERLEALEFAHLSKVTPYFLSLHIPKYIFARAEFTDLVNELNKMPMTSQTLKTKLRKMEIDRELDRLEESIRIFSRPKVYVKLDSELDVSSSVGLASP